jgi:ABC-type Fe2+-enterobactin transport system substrate-binding protein
VSAPELRLLAISEFDGWLRARTNKHDLPYQEDTITAYKEAAGALHLWMAEPQIDGDFTAIDTSALNQLSQPQQIQGNGSAAALHWGHERTHRLEI